MTMGIGGVFGNPNMFGGGIGGGIFGPKVRNRAMDMAGAMMPQIDPETQGAINSYAAMPMEKPRGLFGRIFGGDFAGKMGGLASGLAKAQAYMDGDWGAAESIVDPRQQALLEQAKRQAKFEDWRAQYEYERANPKSSAPNDTERDYQFMLQTVGKDAADNWLRSRGDPFINTTLPNGQFYSGPQSGLARALGAVSAPPAPTGAGLPAGYTIRGTSGAPAGGRFRP